ncbi:hypothetical protein G9C98_008571 [Cotesia typhae]|uniref:Charged multivesicular body protein 2a n=1 Tax=Cotesia typhae TaxID=2053667 RepID=A0A8J5QUI8_9HYME|nr:hypothetical protein G9C98_008571 [Cotesia typhae]
MEWLFGKRVTPDEMLRKNQRALNKAMRDLDRERQRMEQQEKKIIADIKKLAKEGQMDAVKIMAKDLVRTRRYVKKFMLMKANIQAVSLKIQTLKSQNTMANAMKGVTRAMQNMNNDAVVAQVLDELGLQLTDQLSGLPQATGSLSIAGSKQPVATAAGAGGEDASGGGGNLPDADADLQARLENLRRE